MPSTKHTRPPTSRRMGLGSGALARLGARLPEAVLLLPPEPLREAELVPLFRVEVVFVFFCVAAMASILSRNTAYRADHHTLSRYIIPQIEQIFNTSKGKFSIRKKSRGL